MECWNQVDMDVSGSILASLDAGYHAGMTSMTKFAFSFSVGERKIMKHFVVRMSFVRCRNE
jgi:hypothetical protein